MHKEIADNRKVEYATLVELSEQEINIGDIIGVSDNGNPITWDYFYVTDIATQNINNVGVKKLTLSKSPKGRTILIISQENEVEGTYYIHIPINDARDTYTQTGQENIAELIHEIYSLSHREVHWTTRSVDSVMEEVGDRFTREQVVAHMDANPRLYRRLRDGRYEYLALNNPDLLRPVNRRGGVVPARQGQPPHPPREPLDLRPPRNVNPVRGHNHRM